jgi:C1A family cysteine protease
LEEKQSERIRWVSPAPRRGRGALTIVSAVFNHKVEMKGLPVANQKASGRCWLFAACNVLRVFIARKYSKFNSELGLGCLSRGVFEADLLYLTTRG